MNDEHRLETIFSGRGLAVTGVLLMLIGTAFFLDLSFTRGLIGPAERIALGLAAGSMLLALSVRYLNGIYRIAAEASTALAAGILYLSCWAAIALFPELSIPHPAAFAVMALVAVALTLIANHWRSQPIALMGLAGAYLTPLLIGNVTADRVALAAYLLLVTAGLLVLARRRSFIAVEMTASAATLLYSVAFDPDSAPFVPDSIFSWSTTDAAAVASCFFVLFGAAFTTRPIAIDRPRVFALIPFSAAAFVYIAILEGLLHSQQHLLAGCLLGLGAVLFAASYAIRWIPGEITPLYRGFGCAAFNLAMLALLNKSELFDVFSVEGAVLTIVGARRVHATMTRIGLALFSLAAIGLVVQACALPPAQSLIDTSFSPITTLTISFAVWLISLYVARRSVPGERRRGWSIAAHAVALVGITRGILDATAGPNWTNGLPQLTQIVLSLSWALFGAVLFFRGIVTRMNAPRWEGLVLFLVVSIKVFTVDLASLDLAQRVLVFIGTGAILFVSSTVYQRSIRLTPPSGE